jgi:hypothetical protein
MALQVSTPHRRTSGMAASPVAAAAATAAMKLLLLKVQGIIRKTQQCREGMFG